jgi:release factor glutamine methyltransferase
VRTSCEAARRLRAGGVETPALDARILLRHATGLTHEALIAHGRDPLSPKHAARFGNFVARRLSGEPVSRIVGAREFYGRAFRIDRHTLDPRPDTETLVDAALEIAVGRKRPLRVLDLGTGSGCILVTLLAELPEASGLGTDASPETLAVARENSARFGVAERAAFLVADWFDGIGGRFDLIVSNPPYIPRGDIDGLAREVAGHDPRGALDGGVDGLDAYRRIAAGATGALTPGGHLFVEIGAGQADTVCGLLQDAGLVLDEGGVLADLAGRPRCIAAMSPEVSAAEGRRPEK